MAKTRLKDALRHIEKAIDCLSDWYPRTTRREMNKEHALDGLTDTIIILKCGSLSKNPFFKGKSKRIKKGG